MEWFTLVVWVIVLLIALPLAGGVLSGRISLGLQAMAAAGGLALMIAYVAGSKAGALAWVASALALLGVLAVFAGALSLLSDRQSFGYVPALRIEERQAGLAGVQLPMFCVTLVLSVMVALGIGTSA